MKYILLLRFVLLKFVLLRFVLVAVGRSHRRKNTPVVLHE